MMTAKLCCDSLKVDLLRASLCCLPDNTDQDWKTRHTVSRVDMNPRCAEFLRTQTNFAAVSVLNNVHAYNSAPQRSGVILTELSKLSLPVLTLENTLKEECFLKTPSQILS